MRRIKLWNLKYGDKVKIKEHLEDTHFIPDHVIEELKGRNLTICEYIGDNSYRISENKTWCWEDDMLKPGELVEQVTEYITIVKNDTKLIIHNNKIDIFKSDELMCTIKED